MDVRKFLKELKNHDIDITLVNDSIEINFNGEKLPEHFYNEIKNNKKEIIGFLETFAHPKQTSIPKLPKQDGYVLSSSQKRLWVLSQFKGGNVAYNISGVYVFEGVFNKLMFESAFNLLIGRHEILRTVFGENTQGEIRQFIKDESESVFSIRETDIRNHPDKEAEIRLQVRSESEVGFDLVAGPLFRARLLRTEESKWIFIYTIHHIISDGWSQEIMIRELLVLYDALMKKQSPGLPELRIQYKDYAAWQQDELSGNELKRKKAYWLKQFEGELPLLNLPADKIRPAVKTFKGNVVKIKLNDGLGKDLRDLAASGATTVFMNSVAAVNLLLYKYTGQDDIIIGSPIAGREHADLDDQIGFYVNTIPLRSKISGKQSYRQLLEQIKQVTVEAYENQGFPFDALVDELDLVRDLGRNPLFDVMVTLQNSEMFDQSSGSFALAGLNISSYEVDTHSISSFDLTFEFTETEKEIYISIEYSTDLFEETTIKLMAHHLERLLELAIAKPDLALDELQYMDENEVSQLLHGFNNTDSPVAGKSIITCFEEQVEKTPSNIAITMEGKRISYRELSDLSNQMAHYLKDRYEILPEDIIGILQERSEWMIVTILAILKTGAAYLPMEVENERERINGMIEECRCKVVVDERELNQFLSQKDKFPLSAPGVTIEKEHLAYVMYTSGSTGTPKGVMIEHHSLVDYAFQLKEMLKLNENDRIIQQSSLTFDISVEEIYPSLISGANLFIVKEGGKDVHKIKELIENEGISVLSTTPLVIYELNRMNLKKSNLRYLISGGEKLSPSYITELFNYCPIANGYGPTESTVSCTFNWIEKIEEADLIGFPINNRKVYILDKNRQLLPVGISGEMYVSGGGLARGYLNNPELTMEKFVDNPFVEGGRMYKTGDIAKWLPNGKIKFIGRTDDQTKIRGHRVELGEIESQLVRHEKIESAVVLYVGSEPEDKRLIAYIVSKEQLSTAGIRQFLSSKLPGYMIPVSYIQLEQLPLNKNGKVDKRLLPAPDEASQLDKASYVAPRNEVERELADILQQILEKERVGANDNFFDIGGHSIRAIQFISRINKLYGISLNISTVFKNPTVSEMAEEIEKSRWLNEDKINDDLEQFSI